MNEVEKQIMEEYAKYCNTWSMSYEILGKMLDEKYVEHRLRMFGIDSMYIYGGTYLAVQLNRIGKKFTTVKGIVDKFGRVILNENISVLTLNELQKEYAGEKIIVTPIHYFKEIKCELEKFVCEKEIMDIGELVLGIA